MPRYFVKIKGKSIDIATVPAGWRGKKLAQQRREKKWTGYKVVTAKSRKQATRKELIRKRLIKPRERVKIKW